MSGSDTQETRTRSMDPDIFTQSMEEKIQKAIELEDDGGCGDGDREDPYHSEAAIGPRRSVDDHEDKVVGGKSRRSPSIDTDREEVRQNPPRRARVTHLSEDSTEWVKSSFTKPRMGD